jgi:hypothetical protein
MTVALILNLEAGLGHHIWDLTYPRVVVIGRWSTYPCLSSNKKVLTIDSLYCYYFMGCRTAPYKVQHPLSLYSHLSEPLAEARDLRLHGFHRSVYPAPTFLAAFQCIPVRAIWDLKEQGTAKCIDYIAVLRLTVVYEIIAETILFSLPIPIVWKLQMETSKKIQLLIFFSLGIW